MSEMRAVRKPSRSNTSRAASTRRARVRAPLRERGPSWPLLLFGLSASAVAAFGTLMFLSLFDIDVGLNSSYAPRSACSRYDAGRSPSPSGTMNLHRREAKRHPSPVRTTTSS